MNEPTDQSLPSTETMPLPVSTPMYFPVSPFKLIVMSVCTLGIYEIYWYYRNWGIIKARERSDIMPFWRALFAVFFCYSLFQRVEETGRRQNVARLIAPGPLAAGWIILTILYKLPDPFWLVSFLAVLCLVPVQRLANEINVIASPAHNPNRNFTGWNIAAVVFGGLLFVLAIIGTFVPAD